MARILGVEIPKNKRVERALTYIYGIGPATSKKILTLTKIDPGLRANDLTEADITKISATISQEGILTEGDARREVMQNIKRLTAIGTYRGMRHKRGLPVRGQKTHSNARTRKGPRKN